MSEGNFSDTDLAAIEAVQRAVREKIEPWAKQTDALAEFPRQQIAALAELGVLGMNLPPQWGGPGISALAFAACVEAIAGACGSTASAVTAHFLATDAVLLGGDDVLRARYLPDAANGTRLGAFALTEPRAGSNPTDMRCRAVPAGDGYELRGVKHFISNGGIADFIVVFAVTDPDAGHKGISAFVVDRGTKGLAAGSPERTMGLRGGHVFELSFDCRIAASQRLGPEGSGFRTAMRVLDNGRIEVAAMCLGIAQAALDAGVRWAGQRRVGGQALADYQGARRHGDRAARRAPAHRGRRAQARGAGALLARGLDGEAIRLGSGRPYRGSSAADSRRLWLHERSAPRALRSGPARHENLRRLL
jgi:alkylation response protein AidB-like acyl-CoA dehydrogenase